MTGGLFDPLGTDRPEPGRDGIGDPPARPSVPALAAGLMLAALATLLVVSWLRDSGDRGLPVAAGPIERVQAPPKPVAAAPPVVTSPPPPVVPAGAAPARADQEVEIQNGVRIVRPRRDTSAPGSQTLPVPNPGAAH